MRASRAVTNPPASSGTGPPRAGTGSLPAVARLDPRQTRRLRVVQVLFVVGLVTWTSLAAWWATYFRRSFVEVEAWTLRAYAAELEGWTKRLTPPPGVQLDVERTRGRLSGSPFELVALPQPVDAPRMIEPRPVVGTGYGVALSAQETVRLAGQARRKMLMLAGEGSLLVLLLFGCLVGLYRTLVSEWRLNRQIESFVHSVTHELKSPLAGLRALLDSLRTLELPPDDRRSLIQLGLRECARLDDLVANILLSSRLEAQAFKPRPEPVDVQALLEELARRKRPLVSDKGGSILVDASPVVANCDPAAFGTILENLVDNAIKYSPGRAEVTLGADLKDGRVHVWVRDRGAGIAPDELRRVFDKFYRSADGQLLLAKGTGLGLFIARGLARACGGDLRAQSEGRGRGSTFSLLLPPGRSAPIAAPRSA